MNPVRALPALVAALALTACGADEEASPAPETESLEEVTDLPTLADTPSPSEEPFPESADGQDYSACSDNDCEVLVIGQAQIESEMGPLIVSVADGGVTILNGGTTMSMGEGGTAVFGDALTIDIVAAEADRAVLRFIPGQVA